MAPSMEIFIFAFLLFSLSLLLRIRPHLSGKLGGADCWFYLIYVRELKRAKRFPPKFSHFILDSEEQWYPPGFPMLLSLLPDPLLKKWHWIISPIIDCFHELMVFFFTLWITGSLNVSAVAGLFYAIVPTLYTENRNLNSRALSSLLFSLNMLCLFLYMENPSWTLCIPVLISGFLVLMTHKMATQVLGFTYVFLTVYLGEWCVLLLLLSTIGLTFFLSGGFYVKVLRAHFDILAFWRRHLDNLRAHQVLDSPQYRDPNRKADNFYAPGFRGARKNLIHLFAHNPLILIVPAIIRADYSFFSGWILSILALTLLTTFFRPMLFLGEGFKYIKYLIFPQSFFLGMYVVTTQGGFWGRSSVIFLGLLSLGVMLYSHIYTQRESVGKVAAMDDSLLTVLQALKELPKESVLCLPTPLAEVVAYETGKRVLWGAHGYGFKKLEGFFPVLEKPLEKFFTEYKIDYFLLDEEFAPVSTFQLTDDVLEEIFSIGKYALYRIKETSM